MKGGGLLVGPEDGKWCKSRQSGAGVPGGTKYVSIAQLVG